MADKNVTVCVRDDVLLRKIAKIGFGKDGSFMVMVPYHAKKEGLLIKMRAPFAESGEPVEVPFYATLDAGDVEDKAIKLSHHRSGTIQFSGPGIVSGFDNGVPRGIATQSFTLDQPVPGPSFALTFLGLDDFTSVPDPGPSSSPSKAVVFDPKALPPGNENGYGLEGFYFKPSMRRFIQVRDGLSRIDFVHPSGFVLPLVAIAADPNTCDYPGVIGLLFYRCDLSFAGVLSGFVLTSAAGYVQRNEQGRQISGDIIACACPNALASLARRDLNFVRPDPTDTY